MDKLAQIDFDPLEDIASPKFSGQGIETIIIAITPIFFTISGIALLLYLLMGGFQLMTSAGNPKVVEAGRAKITNALLGFVIVFISFWIVQIVGLLFGIDVIAEIFV